MLDRGKLAVLTIFAVAFVAAGFAWWWNYSRGQKCLEFYGKDAALLIRTAGDVELIELSQDSNQPEDRTVDRLVVGERTYLFHRITTISQAKGLIHARTSIIDDTSFSWDVEASQNHANIRYAIRFSSADRASQATLAFDFGSQSVWHVEQGKSATLIPKVVQGWESFLTRQANEAAEQNTNQTDQH